MGDYWISAGSNGCSIIVAPLSADALNELWTDVLEKAKEVCRCKGKGCSGDMDFLCFVTRYKSYGGRVGVCLGSKEVKNVSQYEGWVRVDGYKGVYPFGERHWFSGVTGAVSDCGANGTEWLRCVNSSEGMVN